MLRWPRALPKRRWPGQSRQARPLQLALKPSLLLPVMVLVMVWFCAVLVEDLQQRLNFFVDPQGQGALGLVLVIRITLAEKAVKL